MIATPLMTLPPATPAQATFTVAVLAGPHIVGVGRLQRLAHWPGVQLRWARTVADVQGAGWLVLPDSKSPARDLAWLRAQRLDAAVAAHAGAGGAVLGLGAGLAQLGEALIDASEVDGNAPGLGLLPLVTAWGAAPGPQANLLAPGKTALSVLAGPWAAWNGLDAAQGLLQHSWPVAASETVAHPAMAAAGDIAHTVLPGLAWQNAAGNVLGTSLTGVLDVAAALQLLWGRPV